MHLAFSLLPHSEVRRDTLEDSSDGYKRARTDGGQVSIPLVCTEDDIGTGGRGLDPTPSGIAHRFPLVEICYIETRQGSDLAFRVVGLEWKVEGPGE